MANYFYNGIELPALPAWDKTTYPYAALYYSDAVGIGYSEKANLLLFSKVVYGYSTGGTYGLKWTESEYVILKYADGWGKWTGPSELTTIESIVYPPNSITWSNFDILNEDGTVALKASDPVPVGGEAVEPTNSDIYIKKGDKVYKVNGGAGSTIHTFNSVEEMNAANLADGSIACVPSRGGGGLPVVELTGTIVAEVGVELTEAESVLFADFISGGRPFWVKCQLDTGMTICSVPTTASLSDIMFCSISLANVVYISIGNQSGTWHANYDMGEI